MIHSLYVNNERMSHVRNKYMPVAVHFNFPEQLNM